MVSNKTQRLLLIKKRLLLMKKRQKLNDDRKRLWVHPINKLRHEQGAYDNLVQELRNDAIRHRGYLRMSKDSFDFLLRLIQEDLTKEDTVLRTAISPGMKLAITLHHLSEGASYNSIASHYRVGKSTVHYIIKDTCEALWKRLQPLYLNTPHTSAEWEAVAKE